jgi:hypothetical protein
MHGPASHLVLADLAALSEGKSILGRLPGGGGAVEQLERHGLPSAGWLTVPPTCALSP